MKIGLVLSGGFAKGAYQLGAIKAVKELIPFEDFASVSTSSVGALNGYAFVADRLDMIEDMWLNIFDGKKRMFITELLQSELLQRDIIDICKDEQPCIQLYTDLVDFSKKQVYYKDLRKIDPKDIPTYLKASVAFPGFNKSVRIGENKFFDGGFIDNIPVKPLLDKELDYIICIYFDDIGYKFEDSAFDNKIIKITFPEMTGIKSSFLIKPDDIVQMIAYGYERANEILKKIIENDHTDTERIFKNIVEHNKTLGKPALRLTTDVVITNVNKTLERFTKRNIVID